MKLWHRCLFLCIVTTFFSCEQNKINSTEQKKPPLVGALSPGGVNENTSESTEPNSEKPNQIKEMAAAEPEKRVEAVANGSTTAGIREVIEHSGATQDVVYSLATTPPLLVETDAEHDIVPIEVEHVSVSPTVKLDVVLVLETPDKDVLGDDEKTPEVNDLVDEFVKTIDPISDVKVAVISSTQNDDLDLAEKRKMKVDAHVVLKRAIKGSNILTYAAAASCEKEKSDAASDPWSVVVCDHVSSNPTATKIEDEDVVDAVRGELVRFYRHDAKRIYIFTSRQDSHHFKASDFKSVLDMQVFQNYHVFGLMPDLNDEKCYNLKNGKKRFKSKGDDFENLIVQTGGKVLSVCKSDWKKQFREIAKSVLQKTKQGYAFPAAAKVVEVSVDDEVLTAEQFSVSDDEKVYIKKGVLKDFGQKVKIKAQKKQKKKEARALKKEERKKENEAKKSEKDEKKEAKKDKNDKKK